MGLPELSAIIFPIPCDKHSGQVLSAGELIWRTIARAAKPLSSDLTCDRKARCDIDD